MIPLDPEAAFLEGKFDLDCPHMEAAQAISDNPIVYTGPGFITETPERKIEFKLYDGTNADKALTAMFKPTVVAGQLIPDTEWFNFSATDLFGRIWQSKDVHVTTGTGKGPCVVVQGEADQIEFQEQSPRAMMQGTPEDQYALSLTMRDNRPIPATSMTRDRVTKGTTTFDTHRLDAAHISTCGCEMHLHQVDECLHVQITAPAAFPNFAETRLSESLQFVLGRSLWWVTMKRIGAGVAHTYLRGDRADHHAKMDPPIEFGGSQIVQAGSVWPLLDRYLTYIWPFNQEQMHPISGWLNFVRNAGKGSIFTRGLALGVAVEGVLQAAFAESGVPLPDDAEAIQAAEAHMAQWNGNPTVRQRATSAIHAMLHPRAKDRLHDLKGRGFVAEAQIDAWSKLRNKTAHAQPPDATRHDELQEWVDLVYKTEVLLYHVIFAAIGYVGPYTDYGLPNWPLLTFEPKTNL